MLNRINRIIKPFVTLNKKKKSNILFKNINIEKYDKIIIFENNIGFDTIMKQRPQHIASNFSDDVLFIYHSNRDKYPDSNNIIKLKSNLYIVNLDIYRNNLIKKIAKFNNKYLMIYSTNFANRKILDKYLKNNFKIIYEHVDELSENLKSKKNYNRLKKIYDYLIDKKEVNIICTASKLFQNIKNDNPMAKCKIITNGVIIEDFKVKNKVMPNDMKLIFAKQKPIIGYYGALASWFDYELIKKISATNLYEIVLIGIKYDKSFDHSQINEFDNIHYLGKKDYRELVNYVSYFDVCMIPFIINDITLATSPVKLFEYMAAEKPIITTNLPECRKYQSVLIGKNHEDFIKKIAEALNKKDDSEYKKILIKEANDNTWISKCKEIINFIEEA